MYFTETKGKGTYTDRRHSGDIDCLISSSVNGSLRPSIFVMSKVGRERETWTDGTTLLRVRSTYWGRLQDRLSVVVVGLHTHFCEGSTGVGVSGGLTLENS